MKVHIRFVVEMIRPMAGFVKYVKGGEFFDRSSFLASQKGTYAMEWPHELVG